MPFTARVYEPTALNTVRDRAAGGATDPYHVIVHNLSTHGALVEAYYDLEADGEVQVEVEGVGRHVARVVWNEGAFYDCRFVKPISAAAVRAKLTNPKTLSGKMDAYVRPAPGRGTAVGGVDRQIWIDQAAETPAGGLAPRSRAAVIVGAALLCWAPIAGLIALAAWLR